MSDVTSRPEPKITEGKPLTKARFARHLSRLQHTLASAMSTQVQGMWNPNFCASSGVRDAQSMITEVRDWADWIEAHLYEDNPK